MTQDNFIPQRFHIFGAPGSGCTTLARALAKYLKIRHLDTDDYHWFTEDALPYRRRRNPEHRRQLLARDLAAAESWVLSGALCGWGDVFAPQFQAVVYCWLPAEIRLARIRARETARYGAERLAPGGDLHAVFEKFCAWAAAYDEDSGNLRSRLRELEWLGNLPCPTLRLETEGTEIEILEKIKTHFGLFK
jgi:adenylate kinase family enzyme